MAGRSALVVLIGLGGGVALAVAAGARRTASSFDTILALTNASDVAVDYDVFADPRQIEAKVPSMEGVADVGVIVGFGGLPDGNKNGGAIMLLGLWK